MPRLPTKKGQRKKGKAGRKKGVKMSKGKKAQEGRKKDQKQKKGRTKERMTERNT
jgi:hypothetical protein